MEQAGFDVHTLGFGLMKTYHANDEYASLADFALGHKVLAQTLLNLNSKEWEASERKARRERALQAAEAKAVLQPTKRARENESYDSDRDD